MVNKKLFKNVALFSFLGLYALSLSSCGSNQEKIVLRILNMEDYIYLNNPDDGYDEPNIYDEQFKEYLKENYPDFVEGKNIEVVYDTTDTNETLYSKLQTGKANYDLICPSDYMIQKLLAEDKLDPIDQSLVTNYYGDGGTFNGYTSSYLRNICKGITSKSYAKKTEYVMDDYAVGYMWGTLGIIFNPTYEKYSQECDPINDLTKWGGLWDTKYKNCASIKNSMRDTYAVGLLQTFDKELRDLKADYEDGKITAEAYNYQLTEIFNRCDETNAKKVFNTLYSLKENSFGLEVDSGKQDIVTGKIGINMAWSGDAVYSIDQAGDKRQVSEPFDLLYSIPDTGANIWFDAWVIPHVERTDNQKFLAHAFLNFLTDPVYASKNMDYTGYTSFTGGSEVHDLVLDYYDARTDEIYYFEERPVSEPEDIYYSLFYEDPTNENALTEVWYDDCAFKEDQNPVFDNVELYYGFTGYDLEGNLINPDTLEPLTLNDLTPLGEKYNERLEMSHDWDVVDLSYVFQGTLGEDESPEDYIFYCDGYFVEAGNTCVGGGFFCQYPNQETMIRCSVMRDYRENNKVIMNLWEEFKSNGLPMWAVILIIVEVGLILAGISYLVITKQMKKSVKKKRLKQK